MSILKEEKPTSVGRAVTLAGSKGDWAGNAKRGL